MNLAILIYTKKVLQAIRKSINEQINLLEKLLNSTRTA